MPIEDVLIIDGYCFGGGPDGSGAEAYIDGDKIVLSLPYDSDHGTTTCEMDAAMARKLADWLNAVAAG